MKKILLISICLFSLRLSSQTYNMSNGTVNTCSGTFNDSGGPGGSYANGENKTMTFCSNDPTKAILINFTSFNTESADPLKIYNGPTTASPLVGSFSGTTTVPSQYYSSIGGCLTFNFTSDGSVVKPGWQANIKCSTTLPNNDCVNKKALCGTTSLSDNNQGPGMVADLVDIPSAGANSGCYLGAFENESSWYSFTIANNGTFEFTIDPGPASPDDFDFILWGPNPTCPPSAQPIRCSASCYNTDPTSTCVPSAPNNKTGLRSSALDTTEVIGGGGDGFLKTLNVRAGENYILLVLNASQTNSGFTITFGGTSTLTNCASVPIQLVSFKTGVSANKTVNLEWKTATEQNSDYFQVERSRDGKDFTPLTQEIKAKGNSSILNLYNYTDTAPLDGISYYRLKEVDLNGSVNHFNIETVDMLEYVGMSIAVYPNPLKEGNPLGIELYNTKSHIKSARIELSDITGKVILKTESPIVKGQNKLKLNIEPQAFNSNIYILQVITEEDIIVKKIVALR